MTEEQTGEGSGLEPLRFNTAIGRWEPVRTPEPHETAPQQSAPQQSAPEESAPAVVGPQAGTAEAGASPTRLRNEGHGGALPFDLNPTAMDARRGVPPTLKRLEPVRAVLASLVAALCIVHVFVARTSLRSAPRVHLELWQASASAKLAVWAHEGVPMSGSRSLNRARGHVRPGDDAILRAAAELRNEGSDTALRSAGALSVYAGAPIPAKTVTHAATPEEAHLWRALAPGRPVSKGTIAELESVSRGWHLGWYRDVLLAGAADRAHTASASRYHSAVLAEVSGAAIGMVVVGLCVLFVGIVGVALSLVGAALWRSLRKLRSPLRDVPALACVEAAVFWFALMTFGGAPLRLLLPRVTGGAALLASAIVELCFGVVAVLVFQWWLRMNGSTVTLPCHRSARLLLSDAGWGILGYVCLAPWMIAAALASVRFLGGRATHESPDNPAILYIARAHGWQLVIVFLLVSVLAPVFEERFFRGALYPAFRQRMPAWAAAVLTGFCFAGVHPQLPMGFLPLFIVGAGFCLLYELRGSTAPSVIAHAINNTMVFGLVLLIARP